MDIVDLCETESPNSHLPLFLHQQKEHTWPSVAEYCHLALPSRTQQCLIQ